MIVSEEWLALINHLHDHYVQHGNGNLANQLIKIQEELGEVSEAYTGWVGANPRKGFTHTDYDIAMELADVILTAALAIKYTGHNLNKVMAAQAEKTAARLHDFESGR